MELAEISTFILTTKTKKVESVKIVTTLVYCGDVREIETYLN